jgi:hypothetical protein
LECHAQVSRKPPICLKHELQADDICRGNLAFTIGGATFFLTPAQYTISLADAAKIGLPASATRVYGWVQPGGGNLNFVLGNKFLISVVSPLGFVFELFSSI